MFIARGKLKILLISFYCGFGVEHRPEGKHRVRETSHISTDSPPGSTEHDASFVYDFLRRLARQIYSCDDIYAETSLNNN